jgi:hypothetical protein
MPSFPVHPSELTPAWLTGQLRDAGAITTSSVTGLTTSPVGEGIGMLGILVRAVLEYDDPERGAPASLVAKFATPIVGNRAVAMDYLLYEREVRFYKQLASTAKAASPRCFGAEIDTATGDFVLLLEDLSGYRVGDQVIGCSAEEAKQIIDAVVPLHVAYWGKTDLAELDIAPQISGKQQSDGITGGCQVGWDPAMELFGDVIAPEIKAARDRFLAAVPELHLMMGQRTQTLVHCDVRLDNLMFGVEPDHHRVLLLDWSIAKSTGLQDLAYLTSQNVTIAERRAHESELVEHYQRRLVELGVTTQSIEQTWADYKVAMLYLFCFAIVIGGTLDPSNDRGRAFMRSLLERSSAALMDHDLLSLLPG